LQLRGGPVRRAFVLPARGALELALPPEWTLTLEEARPGEDAPPLAFRIEPGDGRFLAFVVPERTDGAADLGRARALAERALREAEGGSAEGVLTLRELKVGGAVRGFWFAATDRDLVGRAPSRNEWRGLVRGAAVIDDLVVAFDLLDDLPGHHRPAFLELLGSARHLPPEPPEPTAAPAGGAPVSELTVAWPGREWAVAMTVPGFVAAGGAREGGGSALAWDPTSGIRVALSIREAEGAESASDCRQRDWARLLGTPGVVADRRAPVRGEAAFATYETLPPGGGVAGTRRHARAWFWREGLCVDVHLSAAGAAGEGTFEAILRSARFVGR
jgi:hypothetical protein